MNQIKNKHDGRQMLLSAASTALVRLIATLECAPYDTQIDEALKAAREAWDRLVDLLQVDEMERLAEFGAEMQRRYPNVPIWIETAGDTVGFIPITHMSVAALRSALEELRGEKPQSIEDREWIGKWIQDFEAELEARSGLGKDAASVYSYMDEEGHQRWGWSLSWGDDSSLDGNRGFDSPEAAREDFLSAYLGFMS